VMGIMLPASQTGRWIKVSTLPRFHDKTEKPYQVYTTFVEIALPTGYDSKKNAGKNPGHE
ncbi:MAG: hypothetical protein HGA46_09485, partial [Chlorobiaceae bacterium]|nr:hypothetical protein [Chlorobiaceae bacterium]